MAPDIAYNFTNNKIMLEHKCDEQHEHRRGTWTCTTRSTEHTARCPLMHNGVTSHLGSSPPCTRHPIHACAPVCCVLVVFSSPVLSSTSSHRSPSSPSWCAPQSSTRGPGPTPCATSAWGPWSLPTMRQPSQQLYKVFSPCIDDHHFKKRRNEIRGRIVSSMLLNCSKCIFLALIGRPDILCPVNNLARSITKWTKVCDKTPESIDWYLTFIIRESTDNIVMWVILPSNADWDCQNSDFAGDL